MPVARRVDDDPIASTMDWAREHIAERISVGDLARRAHLSDRQFTRRFVAANGQSPGHWLLQQRIQSSLPLLEASDDGGETIAHQVGFPIPAAFRRHFRVATGVSPAAHRRTFGAPANQSCAPPEGSDPTDGGPAQRSNSMLPWIRLLPSCAARRCRSA
jgi:AraC family transcriptional activator FtrA